MMTEDDMPLTATETKLREIAENTALAAALLETVATHIEEGKRSESFHREQVADRLDKLVKLMREDADRPAPVHPFVQWWKETGVWTRRIIVATPIIVADLITGASVNGGQYVGIIERLLQMQIGG